MEQIIEKNANVQEVAKMVKKLKIKETPLKQFSMKLASEYMATDENINNMQVEESTCKKIEGECVDGLYKQHLTIQVEPKMSIFYNEYNYENLMDKYEQKVDEYRNENDDIIEAHSKKQLMHLEKTKLIDMLARQFASSKFGKINLIEIADFTKREVEKLYKTAKSVIEEEINAVMPEEREILKDNHLGKLQFAMTDYWRNKENGVQEKTEKKHKMSFWQWIKHFFKVKEPPMLEEGVEAKRENKLNELKQILTDVFYEVEYAGCFKSGNMEDKVHIMQIDEANINEDGNVAERREMLKEQILIKM